MLRRIFSSRFEELIKIATKPILTDVRKITIPKRSGILMLNFIVLTLAERIGVMLKSDGKYTAVNEEWHTRQN